MKEQTAKADMGNIFQARCLDLAVARYGLLILTMNVNAMIRREKGGRWGKTAGVVAVAEHGCKSSFLKWTSYVTGDEAHFVLIIRLCTCKM